MQVHCVLHKLTDIFVLKLDFQHTFLHLAVIQNVGNHHHNLLGTSLTRLYHSSNRLRQEIHRHLQLEVF